MGSSNERVDNTFDNVFDDSCMISRVQLIMRKLFRGKIDMKLLVEELTSTIKRVVKLVMS